MPSRSTRFLSLLVAGGLVVGVAACSGRAHDDARPTLTKPDPGAVTVAAQHDPAARSIRASRAVFASAPGAVVAPSGDADAVRAAASTARRAHVPLLLVASGDDHTSSSSSSSSSDAVGNELDRLGASWYQAEGDVHVRTDAVERDAPDGGDAPEPSRASRPATVVVADASQDVAVVATAQAAGAHLVEMPHGISDPAAAPDVVAALHEHRDASTLLSGAAFADLPEPRWTVRAAQSGWQLPHGGQRPFAGHRYVATYGAPGAPSLGVLGEQDPDATVTRTKALAGSYDGVSEDPVTPAFEVIATVAAGDAGADGDYSTELPVSTLEPYVDAAHDAGMPVIIDLQPGRSDFLAQAKRYESLLRRPGVWLALDPEWRLGPDQVPLRQIGSVDAAEANRVSDWLAHLVRSEGLPPKALVLHQFRLSMLRDRAALQTHPELDLLVHVDGQGSQPDKQATWKALHDGAPAGVHWGWKNFFDEDQPMLTPAQTMEQVTPTPTLVTYQ